MAKKIGFRERRSVGELTKSIFSGIYIPDPASRQGEPISIIHVKNVDLRLSPRDQLDVVYCSNATLSSARRIQTRDIVVTARGTTIRAAIAEPEHDKTIAGPNLIVIRPSETLGPHIIVGILRLTATRNLLLSERRGAATKGFTIKQLEKLMIDVPERQLQQRLESLIRMVDEYYLALTTAATLRKDAADQLLVELLNPSIEVPDEHGIN